MMKELKKIANRTYRVLAFTGLWIIPILILITHLSFPNISAQTLVIGSLIIIGWTSLNNFWSYSCEGKPFDEFQIGDGMVPETGLKKESAQKRQAMYPRVPAKLLSKNPEGIILGKDRDRYIRIPKNDIYHYCIIGGSGAGKTSTVLLDTLLLNFAGGEKEYQVFAIDIKGELHEKSVFKDDTDVLVVNPSDRSSTGWDVFYRLHNNPSDDLIIEAIEEIAQALIINTNPKDAFFVDNARSIFTGLLIYYYKQEMSFIDAVDKILEKDTKTLIADIVKDSSPSDLFYKYLAKFSGKDAESVEDCIVEMTTPLSVFSKADVKYALRDNYRKASPKDLDKGKSIFLAIEENMLETYKSLLRLCTVQALKEMERRSETAESPIIFMIDEFARLGRMEGIFNALATLRSKKVMVMLAFQSLAQCEVIYSKEETRVLTDNCRVKVICEVSDPDTSKTVSEWAGKYREMKETLDGGKDRHKTYTYEDKNIVDSNDLITLLDKDEEILIISGVGYLRPKKCYYFKDDYFSKLAEKVKKYNNAGESL